MSPYSRIDLFVVNFTVLYKINGLQKIKRGKSIPEKKVGEKDYL